MIKCKDQKGNKVYVTTYRDCEPNEGGWYCQVYADEGLGEEIDNFCVHPDDCDCKDDNEVEKFISKYVSGIDYSIAFGKETGKFYWTAKSNDGFKDRSKRVFNTRKECYDDMRNAVFEKMKWNTEYDEDYYDATYIGYKLEFSQDKITHESYSGFYTYEIHEEEKKKTYVVEATRELYATIEVQAYSRDDARKIAEERIGNLGQDDWKDYREVRLTSIS